MFHIFSSIHAPIWIIAACSHTDNCTMWICKCNIKKALVTRGYILMCSSKAARVHSERCFPGICQCNFSFFILHIYYLLLDVLQLVLMLPQHIQRNTYCALINVKFEICSNFCLSHILHTVGCLRAHLNVPSWIKKIEICCNFCLTHTLLTVGCLWAHLNVASTHSYEYILHLDKCKIRHLLQFLFNADITYRWMFSSLSECRINTFR